MKDKIFWYLIIYFLSMYGGWKLFEVLKLLGYHN